MPFLTSSRCPGAKINVPLLNYGAPGRFFQKPGPSSWRYFNTDCTVSISPFQCRLISPSTTSASTSLPSGSDTFNAKAGLPSSFFLKFKVNSGIATPFIRKYLDLVEAVQENSLVVGKEVAVE